MSYDIYIGRESHNYTSNMAGFFNEIIEDGSKEFNKGIYALSGLTGYKALPILRQALHKAYLHEDISVFDADNGWGTASGALCFLVRIAIDCAMQPYETISVSY